MWYLDKQGSVEYVPNEVKQMEYVGFTYIIEFDDGMKYIGKKNFWSKRKRKFGKREIARMENKRLKKWEYVIKESDWKDYCSSNKTVKDRVANGDSHIKRIVHLATHKQQLTYLEEYLQYSESVIFRHDYYNDHIAGRFYSKQAKLWG